MGIGNARYADILRKIIVFFQRLINFLLTHAVVGKLVTTDQQATDNESSSNDNLLHGVPQHDVGAYVLTPQYVRRV
ncbi:hypothetical protein D3C85_916450 [compost metagenome]